jgi:stage II sporulation protein B
MEKISHLLKKTIEIKMSLLLLKYINLETAATSEKVEDEFEWILPEKNNNNQLNLVETKYTFSKKEEIIVPIKKKKGPLKKYIISSILAVICGTGLGFSMLYLINNGSGKHSSPSTSTENMKENVTDTNPKVGEKQSVNNNSGIVNQIEIYVVQVGSFTAKQGSETTQTELKNKGFATSILKKDNTYYVLAGVRNTKSETSDLSNIIKNRSWGGKQINIELKGTNFDKWLGIINKLSTISLNVIAKDNFDSDELSNIENTVNRLEAKEKELKSLKEKLLSVILILKTSPEQNGGWKSQQILLDIIVSLAR